jgi:hypothetical protein
MHPSSLIDSYITTIPDWRGDLLRKLRTLIHEADAEITEEWKWDVPVFTHKTMVCAMSAFNDHVKLNFFKGAALNDPEKIFNGGLESKQHRSINFTETDVMNESAIKDFVTQAVALNKE